MKQSADETTAGKLRQLRRIHGQSLKQLAETVGCSESMLSKVETAKVRPTMTMLRKLADALHVNIAFFFETYAKPEDVVHRQGERPILDVGRASDGIAIRLERLPPISQQSLLEANIHIVEPGGSTEGAFSHVGEEMGYLLEGAITLTVGSETFHLHQGDSFAFPSTVPHSYHNESEAVARVLWVNTPPSF
ncbi:cupin domain-containing protein [Fulvimarina endophytica]|uniref:Cupin domain-containing protein n=1 Tax=Fulvimarina endophytica TaxID=2293836 RepID=A0A371X9S6_9HYPH|nr:cupin domain-containing protein [Fulvimarina endophytica]RFC65985.1 cupin domain-containing protein [Fulvimarina endophytica]